MGKIVRNFWTIKYHRRNSMRASSEMSIIQKLRWNQPEIFFGNFRFPHIECIEALVFKRIKMKHFLFYSSEALYCARDHFCSIYVTHANAIPPNSKHLHWRSIILNWSESGVQFRWLFVFALVLYCICIYICICICEPHCMRLAKWLRCAFQVTICAISLHYPLFIFPSKPPLSIFTTYPTPFTPFVVKTVEPSPHNHIISNLFPTLLF